MKPNCIHPNLLEFEELKKHKSLKHFSTTINGGFSSGNYHSFNLSPYSGDDLQSYNKNSVELSKMLGIEMQRIYIPYQVHGNKVCVIDKKFLSASTEKQKELLSGIDALITNEKNIGIGVTTADCVPILLFDPYRQVFAVIHAGWRGTVANITGLVVEIMKERFFCKPTQLLAGMAPSICKNCFEVGDEVVEAFDKSLFPMQDIRFDKQETGKKHIDLWKANRWLLQKSGIATENIEISGLCTYTNSDLFFSARRQTIHSGRMLTGGLMAESNI